MKMVKIEKQQNRLGKSLIDLVDQNFTLDTGYRGHEDDCKKIINSGENSRVPVNSIINRNKDEIELMKKKENLNFKKKKGFHNRDGRKSLIEIKDEMKPVIMQAQ